MTLDTILAATSRRRVSRLLAATGLSVALTGCIHFNVDIAPTTGFPRESSGILVAADGKAYIALSPCGEKTVSEMVLKYQAANKDSSGNRKPRETALRYEFDPPVPSSRAFGAVDPANSTPGAELVEFNQELWDLTMATVDTREPVDDPARAVVTVYYTDRDGEPADRGSFWYANQDKPTYWYAPYYFGESDMLNARCGDEPGWDLSVLDTSATDR